MLPTLLLFNPTIHPQPPPYTDFSLAVLLLLTSPFAAVRLSFSCNHQNTQMCLVLYLEQYVEI